MSDVNANIRIGVDSTQAIASIRSLQNQISTFNKSIIASNAQAVAAQKSALAGLTAQIGATKQFSTSIVNVESSVSKLGNAIDKNKLSLGEYFRYGVASTRSFGRTFGREHNQVMELASDRVKRLQTQYIALSSAQNGMTRAMAVRPLNLFNADAAISVQRQQIFNKLLSDGSTSLINFGKNTQWAGRQLMVGFTVPLTIFGGIAGQIFMDLERQVVNFRRVYGDAMTPAGETDQMISEIQNLGKEFTKYGIAVKDTVALAGDIAATGAIGADLVAATAQSTRLATLGMIEMNQAMDATISLQTAFKLSNEELADSVNFLNAVENQTILSLDDVTVAIPKVAPIIKGLGGDVSDLAFFLTAMREGGVNAAEGANALKSGLASLINPTKGAREQLEKVGININQIIKTNKGDIRATVQEFGTALMTLDKFSRQQTLAKVFGKYQFARLGALFENINRDGSQAQRVLDLTGQSVEQLGQLADKELGAIEESIGMKFTGAVERLKLAIAPIGEVFLRIATPIIDVVTKLLEKFNELSPGVKQFISVLIAGVGVVVPTVIMLIGLFGNFIGQAIKGFAMFNNLFNRLRGGGKDLQYLSNEELDAAAAASTLEGKTESLTSALNVQRAAVNQLARSYGNYVRAAGAAASGLPQGFRGAPRRMASGGMVGGSGNKDTEPALLTPGEFVMNRSATEKFGPVLDAMNRGTVGQYAKGTQLSHVTMPFKPKTQQYESSIAGYGLEGVIKRFGAESVKVVSNLVAELTTSLNQSLKPVVDATGQLKANLSKEKFTEEYLKTSNKFAKSAAIGSAGQFDVTEKSNIAAMQKFESELLTRIQNVKEQNIDDGILARETEKLIGDYRKTSGAQKDLAESLYRASQQVGQVRVGIGTEKIRSGINSGTLTTSGSNVFYGDTQVGRVSQSGGKVRPANPRNPTKSYARSEYVARVLGLSAKQAKVEVEKEMKEIGNAGAKAMSDGISKSDPTGKGLATEAGRRSPHRQARQNAKEDATAYVNTYSKTVESGMRKRRSASRPQGPAGVPLVDLQESERQVRQSQRGRRSATRIGTLSPLVLRPGEESSRIANIGNAQTAAMQEEINRTHAIAFEENKKLVSQTSGAAKEMSRTKGYLKKFSGSISKGSMKMQGALFALDGLVFGASMMDNAIGQFAQKILPLVLTFQSLSLVARPLIAAFGLLLNPVTAIPIAIAAAVGGMYLIKKLSDDMVKRGKELSDAMYGTSKSLEKYAEFFGKQTATQKLAQMRVEQVTGERQTPESLQKASEFITSELGNQLLTDITMVRDRLGSKDASRALSNQLERMLLAGVIDSEMAYSIATAVGQEIGDTNIATRVSASLREIVGPDGKNLLDEENRIKIFADIIADASNVKQAVQDAGMVWDNMGWIGQVSMVVTGKGTSDIAAANVAQNLINAQTLIGEELANNKIAYEKGQIGAKKFYEKNLEIMNQAKEMGATWKGAVSQFSSIYEGEDIAGELSLINQELTNALSSILQPELGPGFENLFVEGLQTQIDRLVNVEGGGLDLADFQLGVNLLDADAVSKSINLLTTDINTLNNEISRIGEKGGTTVYLEQARDVLQSQLDMLTSQQAGLMNISVAISSGTISPTTIATILEGGEVDIQELILGISAVPEDNVIPFLTLLEESGGTGIKSEIILDVVSNMTPEQLDMISATMINLLNLPDPVAEKTLISFKGMTPKQIEKEINRIKTGAKELKNLDTKKEVELYMRDNFSTVVEQFNLDYEWISGLPAQQKFVYFDYITRYQTQVLPEIQGDAGTRALLNAGDLGPAGMVGDVVAPPTDKIPGRKKGDGGKDGGSATKSWLQQLIDDTKASLALFPRMLNQLKGMGIPQQIIEMIGGGEEGFKKAQELLGASKEKLKKLIADFNKNLINEAIKGAQQEKENLQQRNLSIDILMSQGMSREDATSISSDSANALAVITASGDKSGKSIQKLVKAFKELEAVPEFVDPIKNKLEEINNIYKAQMLPLQEKIDKQQEIVDGIQEEINALQELNNSDQDKIRNLERQKEMIQRQIEEYERLNELDQRKAETLQRQDELRNRESESLSRELEALSDVEKKIRESYQERIDALEKVSEVNNNILEQQKQQLGLSQALSEGDIYAATAAAQQMRQTDVQFAQQQVRAGLQQGMENAIGGLRTSGGLTREQAEEKIKQIKEQSYQTSLLIRDIEDAIYTRTQAMVPLKDQQLIIDRQIRDIADIIYGRESQIIGIQKDKLAPATTILDNYTKQATELKKNLDIQSNLLEGADLLNNMTNDQIEAAGILGSAWHEVAKQIKTAQQLAANKKANLEIPDPKKYEGKPKQYAAALEKYNLDVATIDAEAEAAANAAIAAGNAALNKNMGGKIMKYAKGNIVGAGGMDSVPAMLTPGEYVIRKAMVDKYGTPMFDAINQGAFSMPRFNTGQNNISDIPAGSTSSTNVVAPMYNNYSVNVNVSGSNVSADEIANKAVMKIKQMQNTQIRGSRGY